MAEREDRAYELDIYTLNIYFSAEAIEIIKDAINTYGKEAQILIAIEEMSELTKALCKYLRPERSGVQAALDRQDIVEEMADVQITLGEMYEIFGLSDCETLDRAFTGKLKRLEQRIKKYKAEKEAQEGAADDK